MSFCHFLRCGTFFDEWVKNKIIKNMLTNLKNLEDLFGPHFIKQSDNVSSKIISDDNSVKLLLTVPGLNKNDIVISIKDKIITISYEKTKPNHFLESFKRTYQVQDGYDSENINCKIENGILELVLFKNKTSERLIKIQ